MLSRLQICDLALKIKYVENIHWFCIGAQTALPLPLVGKTASVVGVGSKIFSAN
jgi:hypothetical protein